MESQAYEFGNCHDTPPCLLKTRTMKEGVFISYRREGSSTFAGILYDMLCQNFPASLIFKDKNKLLPGKDFREGIDHAIDQAHTMLVLIDKNWVSVRDKKGKNRLFDKDDFIRYEIKSALEKEINVIPVLFEGGQMPMPKDLPPEIQKLCNYQAYFIDADVVISSINKLVDHIRVLSTETLGNTITETAMKFRKDPKGSLKGFTNAFVDVSKREANAAIYFWNKLVKKKKD